MERSLPGLMYHLPGECSFIGAVMPFDAVIFAALDDFEVSFYLFGLDIEGFPEVNVERLVTWRVASEG